MAEAPLEMEHVFKKFKKGEIHDSLRDLIPALTGGLLRRARSGRLEGREFWALQDVSFQVGRGEAFGIIGANGAGKSTILKLLSNIMKPTKGTLHVRGTLSALIEVSAGFHPDLTGRENIYLGGAVLGMSRQRIRAKFDEIVAFSGLAEFIDTPVKRYSSGMFTRLGFSVAAHVDPDILIVDEVLSVGDFVFQRKCVERMNAVLASGTTVVFVSHNLRAVADLCPRSLFLERGRVAAIGPTDDVIKAYMGRTAAVAEPGPDQEVTISHFAVRSEHGDGIEFESGQKAWVDVEITALAPCHNVAVALDVRDETHYQMFHTSTERMGLPTLSLQPGETAQCTFELDLHLAPGMFHFGTTIYRYDLGKTFDRRFPAATIFVTYDKDVRGAANLYPRVTITSPECVAEPAK